MTSKEKPRLCKYCGFNNADTCKCRMFTNVLLSEDDDDEKME